MSDASGPPATGPPILGKPFKFVKNKIIDGKNFTGTKPYSKNLRYV